jgi:hypothetical protein
MSTRLPKFIAERLRLATERLIAGPSHPTAAAHESAEFARGYRSGWVAAHGWLTTWVHSELRQVNAWADGKVNARDAEVYVAGESYGPEMKWSLPDVETRQRSAASAAGTTAGLVVGGDVHRVVGAIESELDATEAKVHLWTNGPMAHVAVSVVMGGCRVRAECPVGNQPISEAVAMCVAILRTKR